LSETARDKLYVTTKRLGRRAGHRDTCTYREDGELVRVFDHGLYGGARHFSRHREELKKGCVRLYILTMCKLNRQCSYDTTVTRSDSVSACGLKWSGAEVMAGVGASPKIDRSEVEEWSEGVKAVRSGEVKRSEKRDQQVRGRTEEQTETGTEIVVTADRDSR
jgi:hypothetical protein